jgi:hypothetical protein
MALSRRLSIRRRTLGAVDNSPIELRGIEACFP